MSAGFEEAFEEGAGWQMIARSLVTDRVQLIIPAWVCISCLVLAAALTKVSAHSRYVAVASCAAVVTVNCVRSIVVDVPCTPFWVPYGL